jgi:hypothetical protein
VEQTSRSVCQYLNVWETCSCLGRRNEIENRKDLIRWGRIVLTVLARSRETKLNTLRGKSNGNIHHGIRQYRLYLTTKLNTAPKSATAFRPSPHCFKMQLTQFSHHSSAIEGRGSPRRSEPIIYTNCLFSTSEIMWNIGNLLHLTIDATLYWVRDSNSNERSSPRPCLTSLFI